MSNDAFHLKYRPKNLDEVIGHEVAVTRLRGMLKTGKLPNAMKKPSRNLKNPGMEKKRGWRTSIFS